MNAKTRTRPLSLEWLDGLTTILVIPDTPLHLENSPTFCNIKLSIVVGTCFLLGGDDSFT